MENKKYKLVGILNYFDVVPCSIYPIFMDEDHYLYQAFVDNEERDDNYLYTQFVRIPDEYVEHVKYLSNCMVKLDTEHDEYQLGDLALAGIEINDGIVYIGSLDRYLEFIQEYKDEIVFDYEFKDKLLVELQDEIDDIEPLVEKAREQGVIKKVKEQD